MTSPSLSCFGDWLLRGWHRPLCWDTVACNLVPRQAFLFDHSDWKILWCHHPLQSQHLGCEGGSQVFVLVMLYCIHDTSMLYQRIVLLVNHQPVRKSEHWQVETDYAYDNDLWLPMLHLIGSISIHGHLGCFLCLMEWSLEVLLLWFNEVFDLGPVLLEMFKPWCNFLAYAFLPREQKYLSNESRQCCCNIVEWSSRLEINAMNIRKSLRQSLFVYNETLHYAQQLTRGMLFGKRWTTPQGLDNTKA